jgi:tripartite-type tricarboxylate transporter receptor subunit TctC
MTLAHRAGLVVLFAMLAGVCLTASRAVAGTYPDRAIHLVVPFPPGGPADIVARPLAERLTVALGQPVVVINKAGASGMIGAAFVAKADADGYTLLMGTSNELTMSPGLYAKLAYDPARDFEPITTAILYPNVLVVNKDLPVHTAQDLVTLTRSKPGGINYGTSGTGSTNHLTTELFRASTKVELNYVSYRGGAPAMTDLMGGQIQAMFATMPSSAGLIRGGSIRALMVTDTKRWAAIPDVPTAEEAGLPDVHVLSFIGVLAPAGTPLPIVHRLHEEIVKIMNMPAVEKLMSAQAGEVSISTPEEFAKILKTDFDMWTSVIERNGIRVDPSAKESLEVTAK